MTGHFRNFRRISDIRFYRFLTMALSQLHFDFAPRPKILLTEAMQELEYRNVFTPMPTDEWFVGQILSNEIEGRKIGGRWWIFVDSLEDWLRDINQPEGMRLAA